MADTKVEFASPAWMDAIREILGEVMAGLDTGGVTYSVSEEFTDVPAHLRPDGATSLGWHFLVTDDKVEVNSGALSTANLVTSIDYAATVPVARLVYSDDPDAMAEAAKLRAAAQATGSRTGDERDLPPPLLARLMEVHNRIAVRTQ